MDYDRFIGLVQNRAQLATQGDAVAAIRATLTTLAERIDSGEAADLAAQLPREIGYYLRAEDPPGGERFSFGHFCERIAHREYCDLPEAVFHARCVIEVLEEAVSTGEIRDLREQLPESYQPLFEAGSRGRMRQRESTGRRARGARQPELRREPTGRERTRGEREQWTDDERFGRRASAEQRFEEETREWHDRPEPGSDQTAPPAEMRRAAEESRGHSRRREGEEGRRGYDERARRERLEYSGP